MIGDVVARELVLAEQLADSISTSSRSSSSSTRSTLFRKTTMARHADLTGEQHVLAGLRHRAVGGADDQDRAVHLGRAGDHVLDEVGVTRAVDVGVVPGTGLEPVTSPLPRVCSTTELRWRSVAFFVVTGFPQDIPFPPTKKHRPSNGRKTASLAISPFRASPSGQIVRQHGNLPCIHINQRGTLRIAVDSALVEVPDPDLPLLFQRIEVGPRRLQ
jgi:hypothetical protein